MDGVRISGALYDNRGPLVFSASVHLVLLVLVAIWALVSPDKEPEPFNFELVPSPSGGAQSQVVQDQPMQPIRYQSEDIELPTLDEIKLPERKPIRVEVEMPEPAPQAKPEPAREVTPPKPDPVVETPAAKPMSLEEFAAMNPDFNEIKSRPKTTPPQQTTRVDLSSDINELRKSLSEFSISNLPSATLENYSIQDKQALNGYLASLHASLKRAVRAHPLRGTPLQVRVSCDISAAGIISNVRIVRSSGDRAFDQKVVDGYGLLRNYAKPPKGEALIGLEIEFVQPK